MGTIVITGSAAVQRLQAVVGPSVRLRDVVVAELKAAWTGPFQRLVEPDDVARILLDLTTPSFLGDSALLLIRADQPWIKRHAELLIAHVGQPLIAGALVLIAPDLDQRSALAKGLIKAKAHYVADVPDAKVIDGWICDRLVDEPQGAERPREIAAVLREHIGDNADALLGAIEVLTIYAGDGPLTRVDAEAVLSGSAERPIWDLTGALLDGKAKRAIELLHAGGGVEPEQLLFALFSELRRLIACSETPDDAEASAWLGAKGNLYYARKRAKELGRPTLLRLLGGALQCQRQLRSTGTDGPLAVELFVLHAQKLLGRGAR